MVEAPKEVSLPVYGVVFVVLAAFEIGLWAPEGLTVYQP